MGQRPTRAGRSHPRLMALAAVIALACACATLQQLLQPLQFSTAPGHQAELRLLGPGTGHPLGGVGVRLWAHVLNPNPVGVNLTAITGNLFLADNQAGSVNLPLGLPLLAQRDTIFPVDVNVSFADVPRVAGVLTRAISGSAIPYRLDGRFSVGAGTLGSFDFGPQTLLQGNATVFR